MASTAKADLTRALIKYEKQRNRETYPALDWTLGLTCLRGVNEMEERLFAAIGGDKREASEFFGMMTGAFPMGSFFRPAHLIRLIGVKNFVRLARARSRSAGTAPGRLDLSGDRSGTG